MVEDAVAALRAFNRCYTQRIGVLDDHFLGRGRPLGASRLLFEIGPDGAAVHDLRRLLRLEYQPPTAARRARGICAGRWPAFSRRA